MRNFDIFKPLAFAIPLILVGCDNPPASPSKPATVVRTVCDTPASYPFKVRISITEDANGNMVLGFTNYTLKVAPKGNAPKAPKAPGPLIYICLDDLAEFPGSGPDLTWLTPQTDFKPSTIANHHPKTQYIIHNTNLTAGDFEYSVTVTSKFGTMVIDPRIENGGGGTN